MHSPAAQPGGKEGERKKQKKKKKKREKEKEKEKKKEKKGSNLSFESFSLKCSHGFIRICSHRGFEERGIRSETSGKIRINENIIPKTKGKINPALPLVCSTAFPQLVTLNLLNRPELSFPFSLSLPPLSSPMEATDAKRNDNQLHPGGHPRPAGPTGGGPWVGVPWGGGSAGAGGLCAGAMGAVPRRGFTCSRALLGRMGPGQLVRWGMLGN